MIAFGFDNSIYVSDNATSGGIAHDSIAKITSGGVSSRVYTMNHRPLITADHQGTIYTL